MILSFFLFFLNLTTQSGFYMTSLCPVDSTTAQCMAVSPLDAGSFGTGDYPIVVKAVGARNLPNSIEFGLINIVLASAEGDQKTVARSWPKTLFDVESRLNPYRAVMVSGQAACYEQSIANGGLSRPLRGDPTPIDSRLLCIENLPG